MLRFSVLLALMTVVAASLACSRAPSSGVVRENPAVAPAPGKGGLAGGDSGLPSTTERMIVREGNITLVVNNVTGARDTISTMAVSFGGYVVSTEISGKEQDMRGSVSIRVPAEKFEQLLQELRNLAVRVVSESTNSRDITEEYIDLTSRLKNAEATEKQYLALLDRANNTDEILKIYRQISEIRREIEQIKGRVQYLERTSSTSQVTIRLEPEGSAKGLVRAGWNVVEVFKSAIRGLIIALQVIGTLAIWLAVLSPIWVAVMAAIYWKRRRKKSKSKLPETATQENKDKTP
ncbi:MAG: DUF4349 domain-containing protein [Dehalococcoidia bacterium]|nr:DUF4349 domain-containing protein [Dehalococcoidia bacterium]